MIKPRVDLPSLFMVLSFMVNLIVSFYFREKLIALKEVGIILLVVGAILFLYAIFYLRSGFFGETAPTLDHLVTEGPNRFCRHPLYLSFIIMTLGIDIMMDSIMGILLFWVDLL